ncbi:MAG: dockerin type I repeat-containing protein [Oscillospiraceae bacterium]|nr:dockerin type I repeat-containing protein [Oscillospiraceae bacterium]
MLKSKRFPALLTAIASAGILTAAPFPAAFAEENPDTGSRYKEELAANPVQTEVTDYEEFDPAYADLMTQFGDVNFDRTVGIADAVLLQRFLLGDILELGNWKNADLNDDGRIDAVDFTLLKQQLAGQKRSGGTLAVGVVDMMTGVPIPDVTVHVYAMSGQYGYDLGTWTSRSDAAGYYTNLPTGDQYEYIIDCENLPEGYGNEFGNWDQQIHLKFNGQTDISVNARLVGQTEEPNVTVRFYDWTKEQDSLTGSVGQYGILNIRSQNGDLYYGDSGLYQFTLPDGAYHVDIKPFGMPAQLMDPESDFAKYMQEIYPDVTFTDQRGGIDFTVKDGKPDKDIQFDFGAPEGKSNSLTVYCFDVQDHRPIEGVQITLIEAPDTYAKAVGSAISDAEGKCEFSGLLHAGAPAYYCRVDKIPEGYVSTTDSFAASDYINDHNSVAEIALMQADIPAEVSVDVINFEDGSVMNELGTYTILRDFAAGDPDRYDTTEVYANVRCGEKIALADGDYIAFLDTAKFSEIGLRDLFFPSPGGNQLRQFFDETIFGAETGHFYFSVKDSKPDRALRFFVGGEGHIDHTLSNEALEHYRALWGDEKLG